MYGIGSGKGETILCRKLDLRRRCVREVEGTEGMRSRFRRQSHCRWIDERGCLLEGPRICWTCHDKSMEIGDLQDDDLKYGTPGIYTGDHRSKLKCITSSLTRENTDIACLNGYDCPRSLL